ncbi:MAG: O-antigen ligase family protein [Rhodanobacteraceae bacterium]|nr:O-antigen ligase family protein [Rhodanobacteraceae bacterium]
MARRAAQPCAGDDRGVAQPRGREHLIVASLIVALLGTAWLVDPFAQAGFDAPKRLVALIAAAVAVTALLWRVDVGAMCNLFLHRDTPAHAPRLARLALLAALVALAGVLLATLVAQAPAASASTLRTLLLFALFLPLGASHALDGEGGRRVLVAALLAAAVNAVISLLQWVGLDLPFAASQAGGRYPTGALLGNEAYVALSGALMAAAGSALGLSASTVRYRWTGWALLVLGLAVMLANRQRTSLVAVFAAIAVLASLRWRALRWAPFAAAALALLLGVCAAAPALRAQTWARLPVSVDTWQQLTTHRLGAWAAAVEMIATKPWTGYGPGSYANQAQVQRFAAEIVLRRRLPPPQPAIAFAQAHQEYLQVAAEAGLPVLAAVLAALGWLLSGLLRLARDVAATRVRLEARMMLGVIVAGAVAALTWFPLQIPFTAIMLLLACGRAWRLLATARSPGA